ncbi:MAG: hypothetical protein LBU64_00030 [Planctomycetota bacterium]|jgi:hypothetical protein|nr:hypothetical protein [Planctomycetota bacterium]
MEAITREKECSSTILASKDDLLIIRSSFNEILHGFEIADFENRIGASRVDVKVLFEKLKRCVRSLDDLHDERIRSSR